MTITATSSFQDVIHGHSTTPGHLPSDIEKTLHQMRVSAVKIIRLAPRFAALYARLIELRSIVLLTYNRSVSHAIVTEHRTFHRSGLVAEVLSSHSALRLLFRHWKYAFAVIRDRTARQFHLSGNPSDGSGLQFFDAFGNLMHEIVLHEKSDVRAYRRLVDDFTCLRQELDVDLLAPASTHRVIAPAPGHALLPLTKRSQQTIDTDISGWRGRLEFIKSLGRQFAHRVQRDVVTDLLGNWVRSGAPVTAIVGNAGAVQSARGKIIKVKSSEGSLRVSGPAFRVAVRLADIASVWLTKKPGEQGMLNSLELFNSEGVAVLQLICERTKNKASTPEWRDALLKLFPTYSAKPDA